MKCIVGFVCVLSVMVVIANAAPFPADGSIGASASLQVSGGSTAGGSATAVASTGASPAGGITNILSNIDLPGLLRGVNSFVKLVGQFCPPLSQILDNVIQNVTSTAFRVFGRAILQSGGLGGGSGGGGQRVNVVLPTFPPDDDEDYDEEEEDDTTSASSSSSSSGSNTDVASRLSSDIDLRISDIPPNTTTDNNEVTEKNDNVSPAQEENTVAKRHVRVAREAAAAEEEEEEEDQEGAESAPQPNEDLSNVDADDADRNKRFLPFGGSVDGHGAGGSGNFLFDLIRLVAGSGATEESDEKANAPGGVAEVDLKSADGYTEGIPGPITRLFVIANRGIANLVQDLILRLAQTSERLVNFKARLVTSLI